MIKFRWHRGSLADSLDTTQEFENILSLFHYIANMGGKLIKPIISITDIYIKYYEYDERCNQDLFVVLINNKPLGFIFEKRGILQ